MGGRPNLKDVELGSGYRLVERIQAPHLFAYRELEPSRVVIANSSGTLFEVEGTGRFVWGPYGDRIYTGGRHVRRFDLQTRSPETILELAESDGAPHFAISPDEEELVFFHEIDASAIADYSEHVPEIPVRRGAGLSSVSAYAFGLVNLFHGRREQTAIKGRRGWLLGVCWEQRIAGVSFLEHRTAFLDFYIPRLVNTVEGLSHWRSQDPCSDNTCALHWPAYLIPEERDRLGWVSGESASLCRPHGKLAQIVNDTELRIGNLDRPEDTELVARFSGPQFGPEHGRNGGFGTVAWSPDGRLLAGTLAKWWQKPELEPEELRQVERTLESAGVTREIVTAEQRKLAFELAVAERRLLARPHRFIVDLERREIDIRSGQLSVTFAPIEGRSARPRRRPDEETLRERVAKALGEQLRQPCISTSPVFGDLVSDRSPDETFKAEYVRVDGRFSDRYAVLTYQEGVYRYFGGAKSIWGYEESELAGKSICDRDTKTFDEMIKAVVRYFRQYGREAEMADTANPVVDTSKPNLLVVDTKDGYVIPVEPGQSCAWAAVLWELDPALPHVAGILTRPTPSGGTEVFVDGSIPAESIDLPALERWLTKTFDSYKLNIFGESEENTELLDALRVLVPREYRTTALTGCVELAAFDEDDGSATYALVSPPESDNYAVFRSSTNEVTCLSAKRTHAFTGPENHIKCSVKSFGSLGDAVDHAKAHFDRMDDSHGRPMNEITP